MSVGIWVHLYSVTWKRLGQILAILGCKCKWCHDVMVEIVDHLWLLLTSIFAVPSHHYVGRTGSHIYNWSARWCRTHLGCTRKVKHQTDIFQITALVHLQGTVHWSMYESSATTGHSSLTHRISPTILFFSCQPSGIGDKWEHPAGVNLKKISLHLKNLSQLP